MSELGPLADRVQAIVDDLDDVAFERLRAAVAEGATRRPASDKPITQARRALEKAAHLLRLADEQTGEGPSGAQ